MPVYILADKVSLTAGGTGEIILVPDVDIRFNLISITSTGRVEVNHIEIIGVRTLLKGKTEANAFHREGNVMILPEPVTLSKGSELKFSLLDISGATNDVYITIYAVS